MLFAFIPSSHFSAAALPSNLVIEVISGWKSVSEGAMPSLPFHLGSARARIELGRLDGEICWVL